MAQPKKQSFYYKKVTDFGSAPDNPKYFKALAIRNNLCRKLAAIYLEGKGVKKNRKKSLALALKGSLGYQGFFNFYSKKYFHCECIFLKDGSNPNYNTDTVFSLTINPFAFQARVFSTKLLDTRLQKIAASFRERKLLDSSLNVAVINYPEPSLLSQAQCNRIIENIKFYLVEKSKIKPADIILNCEVGGGPSGILHIQFIKGQLR